MNLLFLLADAPGVVIAPGLHGLVALHAQVAQGVIRLANVGRLLHAVHAHPRRALVDEVDGLVGQVALGDVAGGQEDGRLDGLVGDEQVVVLLISALDALEDLDGLVGRRFIDAHLLEAALQGGVALNVLAVLVQRCRADALQFAAGQRRLEDVGRVDRAAGRARADEHVDLVDEQDGVARLKLFDDALQAFLELAAVHRPGDQAAHVQLQDALAMQRLRHLAVDDALRQPFDDGRLAHAGLADEGRVVLGAPGQYLDDALDLRLAADDRVQRVLLRQSGQVGRQLVDQRRLALLFLLLLRRPALGRLLGRTGFGGRDRAFLQHPPRLATDLFGADAELAQHVDGQPLVLAGQAEEQVFGADVVLTHAPRFLDGVLQDALGAGRKLRLGKGGACPLAAGKPLDHGLNPRYFQPEFAQNPAGHATLFQQQPDEHVLTADVAVVEAFRLFLGQAQYAARALSESFPILRVHGFPPQRNSLRFTGSRLPTESAPAKPAPLGAGYIGFINARSSSMYLSDAT